MPNVVGLVVIDIHGHHEALGRQFVHLSQQLPTPFQTVALEVIAKTPVAQHLEKRVMTRGVTHVFQIIVLAACAQTGLHRGGAHIRTFVLAQKHVFELHHARVGEHQRRVVARHQRAGGHHGVSFVGEKIQKGFAYVGHRQFGQ